MKISLAGPSYTSASVVAAAQQTMNLIPEAIEVPNEPAKLVLYGRPGLKLFATLVPGKIRCMWAGGGRLFVINGPNETEVHSDGTTHVWGTVADPGGNPDPAQIFSNGNQLMIVAGNNVYCDNGAGAAQARFTIDGLGDTHSGPGTLVWTGPLPGPFLPAWGAYPITVDDRIYTIAGVANDHTILLSPTPPDATGVTWSISAGDPVTGVTGGFLDGYFIVNRVPAPGTSTDPGRQFAISALNDGTKWDSLDFGVKEGHSDYIRSILCDHEELWLLGTETIEIWNNVGAADFPFQRIGGAFIHQGSVSTYAPCSVGLSVCWLAGGPTGQTIALMAQGLQPQRISTYAQEQHWNAPGFRVDDAVSYCYSDGGHVFWVINFWQQQEAWVYDTTSGMWHERAAWSVPLNLFQRYQPWFHAFVPEWGAGGKHIVGDPATGKLYEQSLNYYDDDGNPIQYQRAFPHLINENEYAYHHRLEVLMEMGALNPSDPIPTIGLDWSDDHGHTFNDVVGRLKPIAPSGDYTYRAAFRRLGKSRDRVYRVGLTARTKVALIDTYLEMTQGFA
jgi:hypothetical protein